MIPWRERITFYPKQREAILDPQRHAVIEASPKAGKTIGCLTWFIEETATAGGTNHRFLWVAPTYAQAKIAFRRAYLEVLHTDAVDLHKTDHTITLPDGSVLVFASGDRPDNIYGEDYHALVVDEASRLSHDAWIAAQSTLNHTHGRIRIIGNVRDRHNWAYKLGQRAKKGELDGWAYSRLTQDDAIAAGVVSEAQDQEARAILPTAVYRQLYYAEAGDDSVLRVPVELITPLEVPDIVLEARGWDLAATEDGDWTVGVKIAASSEGFWITGVVRERLQPNGVIDLIKQTAATDGPAVDQVIEEEKGASGSLFVETVRQALYTVPTAGPVWSAGVEQNKVVRAWPLIAQAGAGRYHTKPGMDTLELMAELEEWPDSLHDDQLDALAHSHNHVSPLVSGMVGSGWVPR